MRYYVIRSVDLITLVALVNEYIGKGWKLQGGVAIVQQIDPYPELHYMQAMTKDVKF